MKKVLTIVLLCAVILSAASCGNTPAQTENATTTSADSAETTTAENNTKASAEEETKNPETEEKKIPEDMEYKIENGINERMKALSELVTGNKARLAKVFKRAQAGEEITVAYLGGSITQGSSAGNELCYARLTTNWLEEKFPEAKINYVNAGIGATGSYIGVYRTDRDVLVHNPDLVFVDFSVNDTTEHTQRNIESYDGVLRKLWLSESAPAIVTIAMTQENGTSFQEQHSAVCAAYDIPMISYKNAILDVIDNGHIVWKDISDDNIHPNIPGHAVLTELITSYLQDVIDELDTIDTEKESDFSTVYASDKYSSAALIVPENDTPANATGWDTKLDTFGNFGGYWQVRSADGTFEGMEPLKFEVEAKSIGVFYGKLTNKGATFDVIVDGEIAKTINSDFSGGWGSYVEAEAVIDFEECGIHTVEIAPHTGKGGVARISAIAITK